MHGVGKQIEVFIILTRHNQLKKIHFFELIIMKTQQELIERTSARYVIT